MMKPILPFFLTFTSFPSFAQAQNYLEPESSTLSSGEYYENEEYFVQIYREVYERDVVARMIAMGTYEEYVIGLRHRREEYEVVWLESDAPSRFYSHLYHLESRTLDDLNESEASDIRSEIAEMRALNPPPLNDAIARRCEKVLPTASAISVLSVWEKCCCRHGILTPTQR